MSMPSASTSVSKPRRHSKQRTAVASALEQMSTFRSAQDIHAALKADGNLIGLTTVYRALQSLVDSGDVDVLMGDDGEALYRQCSQSHHHHLVCRQCGRTVEVSGPSVEQWAERTAAEHGFSEVSHTLEITGVCQSCARANASSN